MKLISYKLFLKSLDAKGGDLHSSEKLGVRLRK